MIISFGLPKYDNGAKISSGTDGRDQLTKRRDTVINDMFSGCQRTNPISHCQELIGADSPRGATLRFAVGAARDFRRPTSDRAVITSPIYDRLVKIAGAEATVAAGASGSAPPVGTAWSQ